LDVVSNIATLLLPLRVHPEKLLVFTDDAKPWLPGRMIGAGGASDKTIDKPRDREGTRLYSSAFKRRTHMGMMRKMKIINIVNVIVW
jgi:hypothetical protein